MLTAVTRFDGGHRVGVRVGGDRDARQGWRTRRLEVRTAWGSGRRRGSCRREGKVRRCGPRLLLDHRSLHPLAVIEVDIEGDRLPSGQGELDVVQYLVNGIVNDAHGD